MPNESLRTRSDIESLSYPPNQPRTQRFVHARTGTDILQHRYDTLIDRRIAVVKRKTGQPEWLVVRKRGLGHELLDVLRHFKQPDSKLRNSRRSVPQHSVNTVVDSVALKKEPAIFRDYAIDGPHARHLIAPPHRRRCNRNDAHAPILQPLERRIRRRREATFIGQCFVQICEQKIGPTKTPPEAQLRSISWSSTSAMQREKRGIQQTGG